MRDSTIKVIRPTVDSADADQYACLLAQAFAEDAIMIELLGAARWHDIAPDYFRLQLEQSDIILASTVDGVPTGLLLAKSPDARMRFWQALVHMIRMIVLLGENYVSSQRLAGTVSQKVPATRHWYINQLGVCPRFQHRGTGLSLLRALTAESGDDPIYVDCETSLTPYYERAGFHVVETIEEAGMVVLGKKQ